MHRRDFIKRSAALSAVAALPFWSRMALATEQTILPVPPLLQPDAAGRLRLSLQTGEMAWRAQGVTRTWGVNGALLGPAIQLKRGKPVQVTIENHLPETSTVHWHGLEVPGEADGGPQAPIEAGQRRDVTFTPDQPAATCWFHPHTHGKTGQQVAMGLGGLLLLEDDESAQLALPKQWGVDDIPLILQDKRLAADGQIDYQLDVMSAAVGWFGDLMLTNGAEYPRHSAPRGWLRLRLLNGCNARTLHIAASDGRPLYVIASDGGYLTEPVRVTALPLLTGERFEVLVEVNEGKPFDIVTLPVVQLGMTLAPFDQPLPVLRIQPAMQMGVSALPDSLVVLPALPALDGLPTRWLQLMMNPQVDMLGMQALVARYGEQALAGVSINHGGMSLGTAVGGEHDAAAFDFSHANMINGRAFAMTKPAFDVKRGAYERWTISGEGDMMLHPFHIHGTQFRILAENGQPPAEHRRGWKDTVKVEGGRSEVLVRFPQLAPAEHAYMAHCHLLEHEDTGMMLAFTVSE